MIRTLHGFRMREKLVVQSSYRSKHQKPPRGWDENGNPFFWLLPPSRLRFPGAARLDGASVSLPPPRAPPPPLNASAPRRAFPPRRAPAPWWHICRPPCLRPPSAPTPVAHAPTCCQSHRQRNAQARPRGVQPDDNDTTRGAHPPRNPCPPEDGAAESSGVVTARNSRRSRRQPGILVRPPHCRGVSSKGLSVGLPRPRLDSWAARPGAAASWAACAGNTPKYGTRATPPPATVRGAGSGSPASRRPARP